MSAYDLALSLYYARRLETGLDAAPALLYGAGGKYVRERLDTYTGSGYGLDAGLQLLTGIKGLRLGLALDNLASSRVKFIEEGARLPFNLKTGVAYFTGRTACFPGARVSLDFDFPGDGPGYYSAGAESAVYGPLTLRLGYSNFGDVSDGMSYGLGLDLARAGGVRADYSFSSSRDFGNVHKLGLNWKFGGLVKPSVEKPAPAAAPVAIPAERVTVSSVPPAAAIPAPAAVPVAAPAVVSSTAAVAAPAQPAAVESYETQLKKLYGDNPARAMAAAYAMAGMGRASVVEHFIALLDSGTQWRRLVGISGLALLKDDRSLNALERGLGDDDAEVRRRCALALGDRGGKGVSEALQNALKREGADDVKGAIMEALSRLPAAERPSGN